ncbi:hypothetical protein HFO65_15705 [Rhizobium laguerreae]|uniref:hypothetical protein n=1 Tax=Rhizobium laguerreae TaxID=1076926 RepID=UPI001C8FF174|nr:hypothetical protein [Rhizobium laguerreae]MBY3162079.1 hypothetical protein [Rhizobium laguerreae]
MTEQTETEDSFDLAHKALDRMKRASDRGTGCHLTAEMIAALSVTFLGQTWDEPAPEQYSKAEAN